MYKTINSPNLSKRHNSNSAASEEILNAPGAFCTSYIGKSNSTFVQGESAELGSRAHDLQVNKAPDRFFSTGGNKGWGTWFRRSQTTSPITDIIYDSSATTYLPQDPALKASWRKRLSAPPLFQPQPCYVRSEHRHCRLSRALWFHPKVQEEPSQMLLHQGMRGPQLPWERNSVCHSSTSASLGHLNTAAALHPPQLVRGFLTLSRAIHPLFFSTWHGVRGYVPSHSEEHQHTSYHIPTKSIFFLFPSILHSEMRK